MTSVPLLMSTVDAYMGEDRPRACHDISNIYLERSAEDPRVAKVVARIPAASTRQGHYEITVKVRAVGSSIISSSCTCPVGVCSRCKHVHKVLCRIVAPEPIGGPDLEARERIERCRRMADLMEHASVYIALACKSEYDSGSDFRRSYFTKDNYDQEILGVFFSLPQANQCARDYVQKDLGHNLPNEVEDFDEDDDDDDDMEYGEAEFEFDSSDFGEYGEDDAADKVWVERRAIQDASPQFRP